ncbi:uncharacterized protein LOC108217897 [Daucus carota subsp. sativus]|uniref:uncharacterized protein LOC108217897 n=1 Tax=Daucus carota subsp. sativus TaxID=79200 RepID=UPI0007B1DEEA|nr:PREDICTED: uncharacterized protein LOC108217897 [Daucus carota subsp. sativus]
MKNVSLFISVLLLTTLLHEAQGIKSRKLLVTKTSGSASPPSKNHTKIEGNASQGKDNGQVNKNQENFSVKSSPVVEQPEAAPKHYPDVVDLAGMDYSPARRKSPIHN